MSKSVSPSYENIFYIGGTGISGVTDISIDYSVARQSIDILGGGHIQPILGEAMQGEVTFSRNYIYDDPLLDLTGDYGVDGTLIYGTDLTQSAGQVIGFTSGYLTNYTISAEIGNVPTVECTFAVFGKIGSGVRQGELDYSGVYEMPPLCFINQSNILVSLEQSNTNRVTQFSQQYNISRTPIYTLSPKTNENYYAPAQVITKDPIELLTNFTVEVDDYDTANMMDNLRSGVYEGGLSVIIRCPNGGPILDHNSVALRDHNNDVIEDHGVGIDIYTGPTTSGNLLSESINISTEGVLTVNLQFRNFLEYDR